MSWKDPTVCIIGGTGKMGRWLGSVLAAQSIRVVNVGPNRASELPTLAQACEVTVVSVPIAKTLEVIQQVGPHVAEDRLLMDLTSVKKAPVAEMMKWSRAQVVGAHPLFGPEGPEGTHGRVVLCHGRGEDGMVWAKERFQRAGIGVLVMDADTHDRLMGMIQGVQHFVTLSLAMSLCQSGLDLETVKECATPTYSQVLGRIFAMTRQSPHLFQSLLMENVYAGTFIEEYLKSTGELYRIVKEKDREAFEAIFDDLSGRFHPGHMKPN